MRRLLLTVLLAIVALAGTGSVVSAQAADWVRTYPEQAGTCFWLVSEWADGSYTQVPTVCAADAPVVRPGSRAGWLRSYPEAGQGGCVWLIAAWTDGVFSRALTSCPAGVVAMQDGSARGTPGVAVTPVAPAQQAPFFSGAVRGVLTDCRQSEITGFVRDQNGNRLNGFVVRVAYEGEEWRVAPPMPERADGFFRVQVYAADINRTYQVRVMDASGQQFLSDPVFVFINTLCDEDGAVKGADLVFTRVR